MVKVSILLKYNNNIVKLSTLNYLKKKRLAKCNIIQQVMGVWLRNVCKNIKMKRG